MEKELSSEFKSVSLQPPALSKSTEILMIFERNGTLDLPVY